MLKPLVLLLEIRKKPEIHHVLYKILSSFMCVSISSVWLSKMSEKVKAGKTFRLLVSRTPVCGWLALRILGSSEAAW